MTTDQLFPLIVPADYYRKGAWELPYQSFPTKSFILTWVRFGQTGTMKYLTQEELIVLNDQNQNWQQKTFENLRHSAEDNGIFFTHFKLSDDKRIIFLSFMNADGIGSARILLSPELSKAFPNGYSVAFPDRSCGLVIPNDLGHSELKEIKSLVKKMHKDATTPMSGEIHPITDFTLPLHWIKPIDIEFSGFLVNQVATL